MNDIAVAYAIAAVLIILYLAFELFIAHCEISNWKQMVNRLLDQRDGKLP